MHEIPSLLRVTHLAEFLGLFDSKPVTKVIETYAHIEKLERTLILGVTNLSKACGGIFAYFPPGGDAARDAFFKEHGHAEAITESNYVAAICASAALPPVFEPVAIACRDSVSRNFIDGAFTHNTPLRLAIDAGATEVTVVLMNSFAPTKKEHEPHHIPHVVSLALEANTRAMLNLELKLLHRINESVAAGSAEGKRHITVRLIEPETPITLNPLNFNKPDQIKELIDLGIADARRSLKERPRGVA